MPPPLLPLSAEIVPGLGGSIDAGLLKGVAGAVAVTGVAENSQGLITISYNDEQDAPQNVSFHRDLLLPPHTATETDRYPVAVGAINGYALRMGTPPALPARAHTSIVTNAAGSAYELTTTLTKNDIFPHVARLPDHTDPDSPDLVYLDHDVITGPQVDATVTVALFRGSFGNAVGYSLDDSAGIINQPSPLTAIYGTGSLANYTLSTVTSANAAWIDDFTHVEIDGTQYVLAGSYRSGHSYIRVIMNAPTGLSAAQVSLNFIRSDSSAFFVGSGGLVEFYRGFYEKLPNGYSRLVSNGFVHTVGIGPPTFDPAYEGQRYSNDLGQLWVSGGNFQHIETEAMGTEGAFTNAKYVRDPATYVELLSLGGDGGFWWPRRNGIANFEQFTGPDPSDIDRTRSWAELWAYITTVSGQDTPANVRLRDNSVFVGGFSSAQDAYDALGRITNQTDYDTGNTDYYWGWNTNNNSVYGIRQILTWTAPLVNESDTLFWAGPLVTSDDLARWVQNNGEAVQMALRAAGHGVSTEDRHELDLLGDLYRKTHDLAEVPGIGRTWTTAVTTVGLLTYEGALALRDGSGTPTLSELQALDWTSAVQSHASGRYWYIIRIPTGTDPKYYQLTLVGTGLNLTEHGSLLRRLAVDSDYDYYGYFATFRVAAVLTLEYDLVNETTNFTGTWHGFRIHSLTAAEYAALTTPHATTIYLVTA